MASYIIPIKNDTYYINVRESENTITASIGKSFEYSACVGKSFEYSITVGELAKKIYSSATQNNISIFTQDNIGTIEVQVWDCEAAEVQIISDAITNYVQKSIGVKEKAALSAICSVLQLVYSTPQSDIANIFCLDGVPSYLALTDIPSQSGSLTYTGSAQTPSWDNFDESKMTLAVMAQVNAGIYSASFTPTDDYIWSDGTITAKNTNWTIGKAVGSMSLSKTSIALNSSTTSTSFTVNRLGDGAISAVSSDTNIATVSVSGNTVTVNSVNETTGTATITVSVAEGTNYLAPEKQTCAVRCEFLPEIGTALNDISWEDIRRISDAGQASNYFSVGDRKAVTLNGTVGSLTFDNETYYCYIIGIDHNSDLEGANRIHFQFGYTALSGGTHIAFVDSGYNSSKTSGSWFNMNNGDINSGGWESSLMRTVICPAFKNAMPSDLQAVLKTVIKYTNNFGGLYYDGDYVTATTDTIFILATYEVFTSAGSSDTLTTEKDYQVQYAWYTAGNSNARYNHSSLSSSASWWLRSASMDGRQCFAGVSAAGEASNFMSSKSYGFTPAFCV